MTMGWPPYMEMVMLSEKDALPTADIDKLKSLEKGAILLYECDDEARMRLVCGSCLITLTEEFDKGYCECQFCGARMGLEELVRLLQGAGDKMTDLVKLLAEYSTPEG